MEDAPTRGIPLPRYLAEAEVLAASHPDEFAPLRPWGDASAHSVASTTLNRIYHAKRGVFVDESTNAVFLEPNSSVKHSRSVLRAIARLPEDGATRRTLRSWLPKLSDDEFTAAIERVFDTWVRVDGDNVVPIRPGSSLAARTVFQVIMAAPDDGVGLRQVATTIASRIGQSVDADQIRTILEELWAYHAMTALPSAGEEAEDAPKSFLARSVCFIDWRSVMRRVTERLPPEGVTLVQLRRMLMSEGHWSASHPPDFNAIVTAEWIEERFSGLLHTRVARTDGVTTIVTPRHGVMTPGAVSDVHRALLANADGSAPRLPFDGSWRDADTPLDALETVKPARETVGTECWVQFAREHPAVDYTVMVEVRPRPDRIRAITFVDASCGTAADVDGWLKRAAVFSDTVAESKRIALRSASQPAHSGDDIVSPAWLESEFVLAAQVTNLEAHLGSAGSDVRQLVVVCSDEVAETYARVVAEAAPAALERLYVVTPTATHDVKR